MNFSKTAKPIGWLAAFILVTLPVYAQLKAQQNIAAKTLTLHRTLPSMLPLEFEQNIGQTDASVRFIARSVNGIAYLTPSSVLLQSGETEVRLSLEGGSSKPVIGGEEPLGSAGNYLLGNDPSKWVRGAPHFARVHYVDAYPGIDVIYRVGNGSLEYDFVVAPGSDPSKIRLRFKNAALRLDEHGDLLLNSSHGVMRQHRPEVYQEIAGKRIVIPGEYRIVQPPANRPGFAAADCVEFEIGSFNREHTLVIDPVVTFATVLEGNGTAAPLALAVDANGNSFIGGNLQSLNFPTSSPLRTPSSGTGLYRSLDSAATFSSLAAPPPGRIQTLTPDLKNPTLIYAGTSIGAFKTNDGGQSWTALGGVPGGPYNAIALDPSTPSNIYVGGYAGLYRSTDGGSSFKSFAGFAIQQVVVDPHSSQTLWLGLYSGPLAKTTDGGTTYAGLTGSTVTSAIAIDPTNSSKVYVGQLGSGLLITTDGVHFVQNNAGFGPSAAPVNVNVILIDPTNPASVFFGTDAGLFHTANGGTVISPVAGAIGSFKILSLAFDARGPSTVYAGTSGAGIYRSSDGGATFTAAGPSNQDVNALASTSAGLLAAVSTNQDAFLAKIDPSGTKLVYSTYLGGSGADSIDALAVDAKGIAYGCGTTDSIDFPSRNAMQPKNAGSSDIFLLALNATGSDLLFATYFGGYGEEECAGLALDSANNIYIAGSSFVPGATTNFPVTASAFHSPNRLGQDCVIAKFTPNATASTYSILLGGTGEDLCMGIGADSNGNAYVVGRTFSTDFPLSPQGVRFSPTLNMTGGTQAAFVAKIGTDGSLVYSQLLGGSKGAVTSLSDTQGLGIAVNQAGQAFVTGYTYATDFPTTAGALNHTNPSLKTFISQVAADGSSLLSSTLLPGSAADYAHAIALDSGGNVWLAGGSSPINGSYFPVTQGAADSRQRAQAGLLTELDSSLSRILYATFTGSGSGTNVETAQSVAAGPNGSIFVLGYSTNADLSITPTVFAPATSSAHTASPSPRAAVAADFAIYVERFDTGSATSPTITLVANAEGEVTTIAPNTWIEIKGARLAPAGENRIWGGSDFANNQLPLSLDGVSVTVNNKPAYVYFVSPLQLNVLTPPDALPAAPVSVVVTSAGQTSSSFSVQAQSISPSFFVFDGFHVAATHLDGTFVGPASLFPGLTTSAKPGETVILYANGFGATSSPVASGSLTQSGTLSMLPVVKVGGSMAQVTFAGLVAPGEFQFNVILPSGVNNGDQPIVATYNGVDSPSTAVITIQR